MGIVRCDNSHDQPSLCLRSWFHLRGSFYLVLLAKKGHADLNKCEEIRHVETRTRAAA